MPAPDDTLVSSKPEILAASEPSPKIHPIRNRWWPHLLLFLASCASTFFVGGWFSGNSQEPFSAYPGLMYSLSIMGILLVHETGHFLAAKAHHVNASLPYFIPVPIPPIGTFGAIIRMRQPPRTRASVADIGYAGPLAGTVAAIGLCWLGLTLSEVRPLAELPDSFWLEGNSILYLILKKITHPQMGPLDDVILHPIAWAGWLGLLVTSINLLPAGQLDGGHIMYALAGPGNHQKIARAVHVAVFFMGMIGLACQLLLLHGPATRILDDVGLISLVHRGTGMFPWLVWTLLLHFVGGRHPPVRDLDTPLSPARTVLGWIAMAVFVLTFTPVIWSMHHP